ncbi:nicotinate (nicotinamide) nucleotide adenylyltransferase [Haloferula sp. A504]|uniref:nicotinate (nicotinamide) nucleotide adenylyltransferase n=1 Tax=Haloferula sp. A504 TaxID=3373601 RepID=UPI0031C65364|nr:nicotinate (nicotinamide) nucleotide adenylyltransferase [Verrucomicrobiaceae bacterium E54]
MTPPQSIALFGGSFDPVHLGHLEIARRSVEATGLDQVRFLPCRQSPHKKAAPGASDQDRLRMLEIAVADLPWAVVDDFDLRSPAPSYSVRTVLHMRQEFPDARLFWIVGLDQWLALPQWRDPEILAAHLEFLVFSREGVPVPRPGWRMQRVAGDHPASATRIREALRQGDEIPPWLPQGVLDYVRRHRLYT